MNDPFKKNAKLVLKNGAIFNGYSFGSKGKAIGEVDLLSNNVVNNGILLVLG